MRKRLRILVLVDHKQFSSKGGRAGTGRSKARSKAQARRAALARWNTKTKQHKTKTHE
jgi:hypothetical protein